MKKQDERRRVPRRPILDTFSFFVVIPKKGMHRLRVNDVSELGLGFEVDIENEPQGWFPLKVGEEIDLHFYLNQTLYLPLKLKIARLVEDPVMRKAGAEVSDQHSKAYEAFRSFIQVVDKLLDVAKVG